MSKRYQYIVDLEADTTKFQKSAGGLNSILKPAAVAAAGLFAANKIKDAAVQVFNFGKEIDGVRSTVQQLTGLSGGALNNVTGEVKAIADVYKKDYAQVLQSGNAIAKQFGETNTRALELIRQGFVTGADASGDMFNQIKEYSTQFKAAGYEASEMIAIMSQSEKMGIFSDKGLDTIKEATLRIREMTPATRAAMEAIGISSAEIDKKLTDGTYKINDVINLVSSKLNELPPTSAKVGTAIADIFGGAGEDAGLEFIKTLKDVDTNLDSLYQKSSDQAKANDALVESQKQLNATAAAIFGGMNGSLTKAKTVMYDFINDSLKYGVKLINWFIELYNESMVVRYAVNALGMVFKNAFAVAIGIVKELWNRIKGVGSIIKAVLTGNFKEIPEIMKAQMEKSVELAKETATKVGDNYKKAFENTVRGKIEYIEPERAVEQATEAGGKAAQAFYEETRKAPAALEPMKIPAAYDVELPDNLFGPNTDYGQMNALSASTAVLEEQFRKAEQTALLFGDAQSLAADKAALLQGEIANLVDQGFDANSTAVQGLLDMYGELFVAQSALQEANMQLAESLEQTAQSGADSFQDLARSMLNSVRQVITGLISKGVAAAVSSALGGAPYPLNLILAPAAAAVATTAFNSLIPAFADGGLVYGPTMGLMGEYAGAKSNPEVIAPLDKLRGMIREERGGGFGGDVRFIIEGDRLKGVLNNYDRKQKRIG